MVKDINSCCTSTLPSIIYQVNNQCFALSIHSQADARDFLESVINFANMKPSNVFLFYYSLAATTILLLVSCFILPPPQNIANTIILAPVVFFLWTHALNPDFFSKPVWSPKFGAITIVFCLLGIFSYFLFAKFSPATSSGNVNLGEFKQNLNQSSADEKEFRNQLEAEINQLKAKIDSLGSRDVTVACHPIFELRLTRILPA